MERLTIEVVTANAAFGDNEETLNTELARVLRVLADRVESGFKFTGTFLKDINGNLCGRVIEKKLDDA